MTHTHTHIQWNIVGDNDSGYVLTENNNKNCLKRLDDEATVIKCTKGYSGLSLQVGDFDVCVYI